MDILMTAFFHCGLNSQQRMKYGRHPKKIREHNGSRFVTTTSKCDVRKKKPCILLIDTQFGNSVNKPKRD